MGDKESKGKKIRGAEVKHFTSEKMSDNEYEQLQGQIVKGYLMNGYGEGNQESTVIVGGRTYKVLKRRLVTGFYDADGNTLFDVANGRLEKEYGRLMDSGTGIDTESGDSGKNYGVVNAEKNVGAGKEMAGQKAGKTLETGNNQAFLGNGDNSKSKAERAKKKYESGMEMCKPHEKVYFDGPIKVHMFNRFDEDNGFCEDFLQGHKTFEKCIKYMVERARQSAPKSEMQVMVEGFVYLEWMEDYYRKDDKAEEERKAKEKAERIAEQKKEAAERKDKAKEKPAEPIAPKKEGKPKELPKQKKNSKDMDGQLDMFSMMGM